MRIRRKINRRYKKRYHRRKVSKPTIRRFIRSAPLFKRLRFNFEVQFNNIGTGYCKCLYGIRMYDPQNVCFSLPLPNGTPVQVTDVYGNATPPQYAAAEMARFMTIFDMCKVHGLKIRMVPTNNINSIGLTTTGTLGDIPNFPMWTFWDPDNYVSQTTQSPNSINTGDASTPGYYQNYDTLREHKYFSGVKRYVKLPRMMNTFNNALSVWSRSGYYNPAVPPQNGILYLYGDLAPMTATLNTGNIVGICHVDYYISFKYRV